jgi:large subunit ribosomal protein L29
MTKVAEFRDLGVDELALRAKDLDDQLFRLRLQKSMGQLEAANKVRALRRDLARVKTVLREKQGGRTS